MSWTYHRAVTRLQSTAWWSPYHSQCAAGFNRQARKRGEDHAVSTTWVVADWSRGRDSCHSGKGRCQLVRAKAVKREVSESTAHIRPLGSQSCGCDFLPDVRSVLHFSTIDRRGESMAVWAEVLHDGTIGREEALGLAG